MARQPEVSDARKAAQVQIHLLRPLPKTLYPQHVHATFVLQIGTTFAYNYVATEKGDPGALTPFGPAQQDYLAAWPIEQSAAEDTGRGPHGKHHLLLGGGT